MGVECDIGEGSADIGAETDGMGCYGYACVVAVAWI